MTLGRSLMTSAGASYTLLPESKYPVAPSQSKTRGKRSHGSQPCQHNTRLTGGPVQLHGFQPPGGREGSLQIVV